MDPQVMFLVTSQTGALELCQNVYTVMENWRKSDIGYNKAKVNLCVELLF